MSNPYDKIQDIEKELESYKLAEEAASIGHWDWDMLSGELRWSDQTYKITVRHIEPEVIVLGKPIDYDYLFSFLQNEVAHHQVDAVEEVLNQGAREKSTGVKSP
ncbi:MAG: hypothetical protein ACOH5I_10155 [Oligoflexus sp.]